MSQIEERLKEMGIVLPPAPAKGGVYSSVKPLGEKLYYFSGCGPLVGTKGPRGKLGKEFTIEEGREAAKAAILNVLAVLKANLGDLDNIESFVKVLVFVAGTEEFYDQPAVANGATQLLVDVFGEEIGAPSRSAIGAPSLPGNVPVEIEGIVKLK